MTGYSDHNKQAFIDACQYLRDRGFEVVSPKELSDQHGYGHNWEYYLKNDIRELVGCDAVVVLNGWMKSKGATLECYIAWRLKIPILRYPSLEVIENEILEGYLCHGGLR